MFLFFLSSSLFLGWSLGANDASNVFGTAVGSKMVRFRTAAIYCIIFIVLSAVISGAGASHTLGKLGSVNAIAGAFMVACSAAASVYLMTKVGYPVSTASQKGARGLSRPSRLRACYQEPACSVHSRKQRRQPSAPCLVPHAVLVGHLPLEYDRYDLHLLVRVGGHRPTPVQSTTTW